MSDPRLFLSALALTLAAAGVAPVRGSTPDPLPAQLKHCASLTDAGARLACYDALAGSPTLNQAASTPAGNATAATAGVAMGGRLGAATPANGGAAVAGSAASGTSPAPSDTEFGVHNGPLEGKLITPQREKHLLAVVSRVSNRPRGELVVTLDNGQVWVQIEATNYPLKAGDHVEIDVGALGSYVLWSPSNRRATKVTRIS
jgi:hypothetical protein